MKIFIVGAGFTGMQLAKALVLERNNVVLIDNDPERVRYASDQLDCTVLEADGNNLESLEAAGIASADALVTLTEDDETNMITCSLVDAVKQGDRVKVQFTIDGRRWDGPNGTRYFTDLTGWKIDVLNADGTATEAVPVPPPAEAPADVDAGDPDDLPF